MVTREDVLEDLVAVEAPVLSEVVREDLEAAAATILLALLEAGAPVVVLSYQAAQAL
jgi:hypothetical protein